MANSTFASRVNASDADEFVRLLTEPTREEERALAEYLGEDRFRRLQRTAFRGGDRTTRSGPRGNVVVLPGIMGSELSAEQGSSLGDRIWLHAARLVVGGVERLRLATDGVAPFGDNPPVRASGILKRNYGDLIVSLAADWNVRSFWFDWRKDLSSSARDLRDRILSEFGAGAPVHIVAHSMGGLVARTFVAQYRNEWEAMWDARNDGRSGGRLIMLGTPNQGSWSIPQVITGSERVVRKLAFLDVVHDQRALLRILNSFVGTFQLLPSPVNRPEAEPLYRAGTWGEDLEVPQLHLDAARKHHTLLASDAAIDTRMVYVAGANVPTLAGVDPAHVADPRAYRVTMDGDGRVPHELGRLARSDRQDVETYYVEASHGALTEDAAVLGCLTELMQTGRTRDLADRPPVAREAADQEALKDELERQSEEDLNQLRDLVEGSTGVGESRGSRRFGSLQEREIEDALVRDVLPTEGARRVPSARTAPFPPARIRLRLVCARLEDIDEVADLERVDALAVGHYADVVPQAAEAALDAAISAAGRKAPPPRDEQLLRRFTERGTLRGRLGEPFFLPDPRPKAAARVIAVAGMGEPGRFGVPELTVLARELCWSLGRMGREHLATVVIGAGNGNLDAHNAANAWLRGIKRALTGSVESDGDKLSQITFVEEDPRKIPALQREFKHAVDALNSSGRLDIDFRALDDADSIERAARRRARQEAKRNAASDADPQSHDRPPTRITLSLDPDGSYRFGAITESAAVPERTVSVDKKLVLQANAQLEEQDELAGQVGAGDALRQLLFPAELGDQLSTPAPLVMLLDGETAQLHWEMAAFAPNTALPLPRSSQLSPPAIHEEELLDSFLGTSRGFTRQLRTRFAPPPEPPPPPRRVLRVLVIADPAEDAPLAGAREEGNAVARMFEQFNAAHAAGPNRVEVVALLGPRQATRIQVLTLLFQHAFDVLHFAGHCVYDKDQPQKSGWIFSNDERLTTAELSRIDRAPKFVFSNACESGVTADDAFHASSGLAPSFAEAFFDRGVSNLVCTAWPVNDLAAREFALVLYGQLLALGGENGAGITVAARRNSDTPVPARMSEAMQAARRSVAQTQYGGLSWGAYQHYGNPHFRFFERLREPAGGDEQTSRQDSPRSAATLQS